jgi:hypothetical protein
VHLDHLGGIDDAHRRAIECLMGLKHGSDLPLGSDKHYTNIEVTRRRDRPVDNAAGRGVAAHRVYSDPKHSGARCEVRGARCRLLLFFDGASLPAAIIPAVRAHAMRRFGLVTVRTFAEANGPQGVMRAALGRPRFGVSSLWIRHRLKTLSCSRENSSMPQTADRPSCAGTGRCHD